MIRTLLALLAILGFAFVACDGGDDDGDQPTAQLTPLDGVTPADGATQPSATEPSADVPTVGPPPEVTGEPTVTASGLQIIEIEVGGGDEVVEGATITFHYTGWLEDGTSFDSSVGGDPITYPLTDLIPGWQEGIPGMKEGGKRRLIIPPELGYGDTGSSSGAVPPGATLTFDIQVLDTQ
jgi:FKBP-type peptidyl-prolyl cis-trans isomerase